MTLTTLPIDEWLDLPAYRGQRVDSFTFEWKNGVTDQTLGFLTPDRDPTPTLSHNTSQAIKRRLTLSLGVDDTASIDPLTDRILLFMTVGGTTYTLGRYMFTDESDLRSTRGDRGSFTLLDEGFIIDQQLETAFSSTSAVTAAVLKLIEELPIVGSDIEASPFLATGSFSAGQTRGQVLEAYATQGDFFPYWMNNDGIMRMIRTKDPATSVVDLDFDAGNKVVRGSIAFTSDVLLAPNRFIVISNSGEAQVAEISGVYDVPPSAPHSITNRGFVIPRVQNLQLTDGAQAAAVARGLGLRQTVYERVTLSTALDPRHDGYNIIRFQGDNWLELSWDMELRPGGQMQHTMRKAYA